MWQRFTERARRVILLGQEEAAKMNSGQLGTEHLLLGLIREGEGVGAQVLLKMGVSLEQVRREIEVEVQSPAKTANGEPKLTPIAKRALELAADESRRMRHNYIGTEHLLLALLREKDEVAARVLHKLGMDLDKTRREVEAYLGPDEAITEKAGVRRQYSAEQFQLIDELIQTVQMAMNALVDSDNYEMAARIKDKLDPVTQKLEELKNRHQESDANSSSEN